MTDDIVERLRQRDEYDRIVVLDHLNRPYGLAKSLEHEAADEIDRLRAALENLVIAIGMDWDLDGVLDAARAALGEDSND